MILCKRKEIPNVGGDEWNLCCMSLREYTTMRLSLYHTECNHIIKAVHRLHIADLIPSKCRLNMLKNKQNFLESTQNPSTVVDNHTPPLVA